MDKNKRLQIIKTVRNIVISAVSLLVLLVGVGFAYTWWMGQQSVDDTSAINEPIEFTKTPVIEPRKPAPDARIGASVQTLTSPVSPGMNSSITVRTNAGAKCTIAVIYNEIASKDSGLIPKVTNEFGMVSWTWTVEKLVPIGKWPVNVTCANIKNSAFVRGNLIVAKTIE